MGLLKFSGKRLGRQLAWERKRELNNKRIILEIGKICAIISKMYLEVDLQSNREV